MMLYSLCYTSRAVLDFEKDHLLSLLAKARSKNSYLNITGLLLHGKGVFIQILEGDKDDVLKLYDEIKDDPRHINVTTIYNKQIQTRAFPDWSMGFELIDEIEFRNIPAINNFLNDTSELDYLSNISPSNLNMLLRFKKEPIEFRKTIRN